MSSNSQLSSATRKEASEAKIHGVTLTDYYAWLRDPNWPDISSKEVLSFLKKENEISESYLSNWSDKREELVEELKGRIAQFDESPPKRLGEFLYWVRFDSGKEYPAFYRKSNDLSSKEELVLDVNLLAEGQEFTRVPASAPSPDNNYFAYCIDHSGKEKYEIRVLDLKSKCLLQDCISGVSGQIVWHKDLHGFFYAKLNERSCPDKVFFHELGSDNESDRLIFFEPDSMFSLSVHASESRDYIFITSNGHATNECRFIQSCSLGMQPCLIKAKEDGIFYDVEHHGKNFYLRINDQGGNFRVACLPIDSLEPLSDFINYDSNLYLEGFSVSSNYFVVSYKRKGIPLIRVGSFEGSLQEIDFPDEAYEASAYCANFQDDDLRVHYSSLRAPDTTFQYCFSNNSLSVLKRREIPSGFDPEKYVVRRLEVERNGARIPITVLAQKGFEANSNAPLYLTAYGAYGIPAYVGFSSFAISLVNRGFVFAVAHVRGGDELGHDWYEQGKFLSKANTFDDFIACTEHLIKDGYTTKGNIAISGGSAGGMLVGAVINRRPELYKCATALVPFVDVLNTMLDSNLPLTQSEYKEWGDPNQEEYFRYIKSYCPYQNISKQAYPHVFATAGLSDFRVGYWEPAKWVTKLREFNTAKSHILLKTKMDSGHQGTSGRFKHLHEVADELTFIFSLMLPEF